VNSPLPWLKRLLFAAITYCVLVAIAVLELEYSVNEGIYFIFSVVAMALYYTRAWRFPNWLGAVLSLPVSFIAYALYKLYVNTFGFDAFSLNSLLIGLLVNLAVLSIIAFTLLELTARVVNRLRRKRNA